jgi:molybdopterin-guanine dinucleotide biosynthesis protein
MNLRFAFCGAHGTGKTTVLKDGFYEKLTSKTVKNLKKKGALSGCSIVVIE